MYGGARVCPKDLPRIAYAGQPVISGGWVPGYNQGFNYIFINGLAAPAASMSARRCSPMPR